MATEFIFDGKKIKQPGTYATTKSGIKNPPLALSFGNILLIDTGLGAGWGCGSGIAGTLKSAKEAIYEFDNVADLRACVKGGMYWRLADPLFRPAGPGIAGVSKAYVVRAAATVPAELSYTWTGGGANGGTFTLQMNDEGLVGNAIEGDGTNAVGSFQIDTAVLTDVIDVQVDEGTGAASIGSFTVDNVDTSLTAASVANAINNNAANYTATSNANVVTVTARNATGFEANTDWNSYPLTVVITGTSTFSALVSFAGGVDGSKLTQGFAATMEAGIIDTAKFVVKFWVGEFTGLDSDGDAFSGTAAIDTTPTLLTKSPEFDNIQTLIDWMTTDSTFGAYFTVKSSSVAGDGSVNAADLAASAGNNKAVGGTETYSATHLQTVLDNIAELDYTFILSDQYGANAQSADNTSILTHIVDEARYEKFLVIAGGDDSSTWASQSLAAAQYWDNDRVIVVHGGPKVASRLTASGFKDYDALYKAAGVLGRIAGLEPQVPGTFKNLKIQGERHQLNDKEVEQALDAGLLVTKFDTELANYVIVQAINSLQKNKFLVNDDGTSHSVAVKRIAAQLNKEIVANAKVQLLGQTNGPNRNTLSSEDVVAWLRAYLRGRTATATVDNLILGYQDISVTVNNDAYFITYAFIPNFPVNKLFFTGFIIDPNI